MSHDAITVKDEYNPKKGIVIFGKNVSEITCFRNSFLFGICGGIFAGLVCFMMTSKPGLSSNVCVGSMCVGVLTYWIPCRYKHESKMLRMEHFKEQINKKRQSRVVEGNEI